MGGDKLSVFFLATGECPLQPIPIIETTLNRLVVDTIAPLARPSKSGKIYITVVGYATRYLEAVVYGNITAAMVAGALKHHCKSHSHILSLSLLLLLAAGDISPNPGPSLISTCFQPRSTPRAKNTRKTQNLIPITCHKPSTLPFSCALWNARSICNKLTFTHDLFTTNSLNLLALTETWLSSSDTASPAALSHGGFHLSHTPRPGNKQGGGVGVLLSSRCTFHLIPPVPSLQFSSFEAHTIRLFSPISLRVAVIYRPPGTSSQFLDHFSAWLPHFLSSNIPTLILGDFNIAIDTPTSSAAAKLLALTSSLGLSQLTDSSTHHAVIK
ncbi:uncharacterized protein O3C94_008651 [Discoglossus pictus]